jgi:hypothetical protein
MKQQRMHSDEEDAPLTEHLLEHFAGWYLICVVAVQALEHARLLHAINQTLSLHPYGTHDTTILIYFAEGAATIGTSKCRIMSRILNARSPVITIQQARFVVCPRLAALCLFAMILSG